MLLPSINNYPDPRKKLAYVKYFLRAVYDGLRNKTGKFVNPMSFVMKPKVLVLVAVYNGEKWLIEQIYIYNKSKKC